VPKPKKSPENRRGHPRQVKFTDAENASFEALAESVAAGGPRHMDAHLLLWLVEQECKRRGISWPGDAGAAHPPPPRPYQAPTPPPLLKVAEAAPDPSERFVDREDAPTKAPARPERKRRG
jgi:hypothetical protein